MSVELPLVLVVALLVVGALLLFAYLMAHRLDRLHIRADLARAALFGVLGRRHVVAAAVANELAERDPALAEALSRQLDAARRYQPEDLFVPDSRSVRPRAEHTENAIGISLGRADPAELSDSLAAELDDIVDRLEMARRFHNDAVRDTRAVRELWVVKVFRLAGRAPMPDYVELVEPEGPVEPEDPVR